jgi:hypothetical protein
MRDTKLMEMFATWNISVDHISIIGSSVSKGKVLFGCLHIHVNLNMCCGFMCNLN